MDEAQGVFDPGAVWGALGAGLAYVDPFPKEAESSGKVVLGVKALPMEEKPRPTTIEEVLYNIPASLRLDFLFGLDGEELDLGGSVRLYQGKALIPLNLGLNHTDPGWGWHVYGDFGEAARAITSLRALALPGGDPPALTYSVGPRGGIATLTWRF
jgi:hypothetical protein